MEHIGHLEWEKRYDAAIAKGRGTAETGPDRETAIAELKALNLTVGEAEAAIDRGRKAL